MDWTDSLEAGLPALFGPAALLFESQVYLGQEASISARTVSRSAAPETQSVMPFQKEPAPTSPGIRSEPSKRKLVAS